MSPYSTIPFQDLALIVSPSVTNKYICVEENHTIDLALLTQAGDGCAKSALLELGLLNIL